MLKELAQYIEDETALVIGTDLFAGYIPEGSQEDCIVLIESGGDPNTSLSDAGAATIQILSRAKDYWTARDNAYLIYNFLHCAAGITLPVVTVGKEYYINTISAIAFPQSVGQDDRGLFNVSTNFILQKQDK